MNPAAHGLSPVSPDCSRLLSSPHQVKRKIPTSAYKVLDVPSMPDNFYFNLLHWSSQNVLAVGLNSAVYLWNASTGGVTQLCEMSEGTGVTSVMWDPSGARLAVGSSNSHVRIWDARECRLVRTFEGHADRVGSMAWSTSLLATGSRDHTILKRDDRDPRQHVGVLAAHRQEVCGLQWSCDERMLASGGNDNRLLVWDVAGAGGGAAGPLCRFTDHTAAVKALAWSPHQHGLLASGGGTSDRTIRFWNVHSGSMVNCVDTGSQVCNLGWSKTVNELVSTHGYSLYQVVVWRYPGMQKLATLTGHTHRVMYMAMSADGQTVATAAADETLRFWNVFPGRKDKRVPGSMLLSGSAHIR